MGIIRLTLVTVAAIGGAMSFFGRNEDLPIDRIGREPSIAQETIEAVSAPAVAEAGTPAASTAAVSRNQPEIAPTQVSFAAVQMSQENTATPETAAEKAEAAARKMANGIKASSPATTKIQPRTDQQAVFVGGTTVNMRAGPSTKHGIVAKLTRGTEVIDMGSAGEGWSQIKVVDTGTQGFMATRFLVPVL